MKLKNKKYYNNKINHFMIIIKIIMNFKSINLILKKNIETRVKIKSIYIIKTIFSC